MEAEDLWGARWTSSANPLAHRYMETAARKQTLVCLAADMRSVGELIDLVEEVGPCIAALKTHVDMVDDFSRESWQDLVDSAKKHDLLLFEDRKFADIGKVSQNQKNITKIKKRKFLSNEKQKTSFKNIFSWFLL